MARSFPVHSLSLYVLWWTQTAPPHSFIHTPTCVCLQAVRGLFGAAGAGQEEAVDQLEGLQASIRLVKALFRDQQATEVGVRGVRGWRRWLQ